jgi:hypothetical protein
MIVTRGHNYSGYLVSTAEILDVLERNGMSPRHPRLHAHHVTHRYPDDKVAPAIDSIEIIGHASDDDVDCLVVALSPASEPGVPGWRRPDGGVYHCTISTADGVSPRRSNDLLALGNWRELTPTRIAFDPF